MRRTTAFLVVVAAIAYAVAAVLIFHGRNAADASAASSASLPIPSTRSVRLDARTYMVSWDSHYTGPAEQAPPVPVLSVAFEPPSGVSAPEYVFAPALSGPGPDQIGTVTVHTAGTYQISVRQTEASPGEPSGSLLIGEPPSSGTKTAWLVGVAVAGALLAVLMLRDARLAARRRRQRRRSRRGVPA